MAPMMFIVWGTKVRNRSLGARAEFCNGCLRVCQHEVLAVEHASHIYYIHGRWREQARYHECGICGTLDHAAEAGMLLDKETAFTHSVESLVAATNPDLSRNYGDIAQDVEANLPESERDTHILDCFCARSTEEFKQAEHDLSGWLGIVLILFSIGGGLAFAAAGTTIGIIVSVVLLVVLMWLRSWAIHRRVAKRVRPRLNSLLSATGIKWERLESDLASGKLKYSRLRRHFARSAYDAMDIGNWSDRDGHACDFLVPTVDMSPPAQSPDDSELDPGNRQSSPR
jgi:hypothetical protein